MASEKTRINKEITMEIFKTKPEQWGLRGDPELWNRLSKKFENFDDPKNEIEFNKKLDFEFHELLKKGKRKSDTVWFEDFSQSGMSGGQVYIKWWTNKGLPLLKERYSSTMKTIPFEYKKRLDDVTSSAWTIFKSQFIHNRHNITKEAPFQHHFADIIRQVGNLYCLNREDVFLVDLETKCTDIRGKTKYLDITCEFVNQISCAIELKFKTAVQGAQDYGRIDFYVDIEALELVCAEKYDIGKFYAITNSTPYINKSKVGIGTIFPTHNGHITEPNKTYSSNIKGRKDVVVHLKTSYTFNWEKINNWYFLELTIDRNKFDKHQPLTRGLAIVGGDKTRISTLGTLLNFGSSSTERNRTAGI